MVLKPQELKESKQENDNPNITLHPCQVKIAECLKRFRVVNCGRRFGKTVLACEEMIGVAISKKGRRVAYYAPTRDDAQDIMWEMLSKRLEGIAVYTNKSRLEVKIRTQDGGYSIITLYGWEATQERQKGRGLANDFIVCDEVSQYRNFTITWNEVLSPTLIDRKGSVLFIGTPKGFNHFYDLAERYHESEDWAYFHFTSYDNPHIPASEIEREKLTMPSDTFEQEYMGDWRKRTGLVYKEFNRDLHVSKEKPTKINETILGIDFGYTNPSTVLPIDIDGDTHFWISKEWYETKQTSEQIAEIALSFRAQKAYPDPAEPDRIKILREKGINVRQVSKDIVAGVDHVRELFKQNRIHIHPNCKMLIQELETYHYPDNKVGLNAKELPVKEGDHLMDALRYALYTNKPIIVEEDNTETYYEDF